MHYIETLREGERVNEIYLCKDCRRKCRDSAGI